MENKLLKALDILGIKPEEIGLTEETLTKGKENPFLIKGKDNELIKGEDTLSTKFLDLEKAFKEKEENLNFLQKAIPQLLEEHKNVILSSFTPKVAELESLIKGYEEAEIKLKKKVKGLTERLNHIENTPLIKGGVSGRKSITYFDKGQNPDDLQKGEDKVLASAPEIKNALMKGYDNDIEKGNLDSPFAMAIKKFEGSGVLTQDIINLLTKEGYSINN